MATKQNDKSGSKPRQRTRKVVRPSEKLDQTQSPKFDQASEEAIVPAVAAIEAVAVEETVATGDAVAVEEAAPVEFAPSEILVPMDQPSPTEVTVAISLTMESAAPAREPMMGTDHVSIQSIANAYSNYVHKSLEQTGSLVEKLISVRTFDKAAEVQIEFARQAYANLIAESHSICELYSRLTRQIFRSWQGLAIGTSAN